MDYYTSLPAFTLVYLGSFNSASKGIRFEKHKSDCMTHLHMITTFSFRDPLALPHLLLLLTTSLTLSQPCWPSCFCPLNLRRHRLSPCAWWSLSKILFSLNTRFSVPSGLYSVTFSVRLFLRSLSESTPQHFLSPSLLTFAQGGNE